MKTPAGPDWHLSGEELDAAREVAGEYEDVATAVYEGDSDEELEPIFTDAEVEKPWRIIGRIENLTNTTE